MWEISLKHVIFIITLLLWHVKIEQSKQIMAAKVKLYFYSV